MSHTQIVCSRVQKIFRTTDKEVVALKDIELSVRQGEFVCLLGPSGCGKSTLLNAIAGFSLPTSGTITVDVAGQQTTLAHHVADRLLVIEK